MRPIAMILDATCQLEYETQEQVPVVFMLRPRSGWAQWVMSEQFDLNPRVPVIEYTDVYGNLCQKTVMPPGVFKVCTSVRASVPDQIETNPEAPLQPVQNLAPDLIHYLLPSRYCQSDLLVPLAMSIVGNSPRTYAQVTRIRNWVHDEIRDQRGSSNSSTSALETLNAKAGVCRDFAHLGIALCRANNVPARMVVGFVYNLKPMDLHAWFEAFIGDRWFAFDAMEDETQGNRIVVAYGRDAADVALATLFGNFQLRQMMVTVTATKP